jgi:hypothetical protein
MNWHRKRHAAFWECTRSVSEYSIPACRLEWDWISFQDVELDCDGSESEVSRFRIQAE